MSQLINRTVGSPNARDLRRRNSESSSASNSVCLNPLDPDSSDLTLVIPVFAEGHVIAETCDRLDRALASHSAEVIFVDDGSTDGSRELLQAYVSDRPHVKLLSFRRNFGQACALLAGIEATRTPIVVTLDADPTHDIAVAFDLADRLKRAAGSVQIVAGYRVGRRDPRWRLAGSRCLNGVVRALGASPFADLGFLLKAWQRSVALEVFRASRGRIELGRLLHAVQGVAVENVPVWCETQPGRSSYGAPELFHAAIDTISAGVRIRLDRMAPLPPLERTTYELEPGS